MNFIHRFHHAVFKSLLHKISDELWVELLESGATVAEIQLHFGSSESLEDRVLRLNTTQRKQYALYITRFSPRMALWWVLLQKQQQASQRNTLLSAIAYPSLLMGLAFSMIELLNHVMLPRINTLFALENGSNALQGWSTSLFLLEMLYVGMFLFSVLIVCLPQRSRKHFLTNNYHHPLFGSLRLLVSQRFLTMLIQAQSKGVAIHDLLFVLTHGNDFFLSHFATQINDDLLNGLPLGDAMGHLDLRLKQVLIFHNTDHPLDTQLKRYASMQTLRFQTMIKQLRNGLLIWAYANFGIILISAYQMMFEPIRRLEQWL
jgi:type II secretory pathway component PulF